MSFVQQQVHAQVEQFLVKSIDLSALLDNQLKVKKDCGVRALGYQSVGRPPNGVVGTY